MEAIAHLERGLDLLHSLPDGPGRDRCEIDLQLVLAGCVLAAKGAAAAKLPYMRAFDLAESTGSSQQRFDALYGVWQSTNMSGGSAAASPLSARLLSMTEQEGDDGLRLQAHHSAWATLAFAGDPAKTREHTDAGRLLYDPEKHASHRFIYGGHDPGVCARLLGSWAEWLLGYPETAFASVANSVSMAERIDHPFTLSLALTFCAVLHLNRREPERALSVVETAEALVAEQRLSLPLELGIVYGAALVGQDGAEEAIARIRQGVTKSTGLGRPYGLAFLAEGLAWHGDRVAALAALQEGLEIARTTGEHGGMRNCTASSGLCCSPKISSTRARLLFSRRSALRKPNKQNRWNCAPSALSPGCGASKAGAPKPATLSPPSIAGLPKGSTPLT